MKKLIGSVFEIKVDNESFWGCVTCHWIMSGKKLDSITFVLLENPKSPSRIACINLPTGTRYSFYTSQKWVGSHWPIVGKVDISKLPDKLFCAESAGFLHDYRLTEHTVRFLEDDEMLDYQTLSTGNYSVVEYILEHASVEFIDAIPENIVFK